MINDRASVVRRGLLLNYATIGYNLLEAVAAIVAGVLAGSVALLGFGLDSVVEVTSSVAAQWRLRRDDEATRHRSEEISLRVIGISFLVLAAYVTYESMTTLWFRESSRPSVFGIVVLAASVVVMPWLSYKKARGSTRA